MADDWHFAQQNQRQGPVSFERLQKMAKEGWLHPTDLVWHSGLPEWTPAGQVQGLFPISVGTVIQKTWQQLLPDTQEATASDTTSSQPSWPPAAPEKPLRQRAKQARATQVTVDWHEFSPRHVIAAIGGFLAALGVAFTVIAQSRVSLAFTIGGLVLVVVGLAVEVGKVLAQAVANIGRALGEASERRLRAKELALEKRRLDLEVARLAHQDKALSQLLPPQPVDPALASEASPQASHGGNTVVINQPPVRLWSPGLAAVLSFFMPGLGQLYKGQFFNAVAWFFIVMLGYAALIVPGLILHFFCVLGALSGNPWTEGKTMVVRQ